MNIWVAIAASPIALVPRPSKMQSRVMVVTCADRNNNPQQSWGLTPGQAHDLAGAGAFLPGLQTDALLGDIAYDANDRVRKPPEKAGKKAIIPSTTKCIIKTEHDKAIYKARHLVENFFAKLKQFSGIATRDDKTAKNFLAAVFLVGAYVRLN
ncbi:MAG: transposase [Proteobacteria bacterium]|nr:transposase [Pseudomonadota bacterium]